MVTLRPCLRTLFEGSLDGEPCSDGLGAQGAPNSMVLGGTI